MFLTIKDHTKRILFIFIMVLIMTLQARNEKGVRLVALSPTLSIVLAEMIKHNGDCHFQSRS